MHEYLISFLGGILIGMAVIGYLFVTGKIAGISGLLSKIFNPATDSRSSAFWFLGGIILFPALYSLSGKNLEIEITGSPALLIVAGLLVGFGTRLGSGCTSGHGICGISRLSIRSIVATLCFMFFGFLTVYIIRHVMGAI